MLNLDLIVGFQWDQGNAEKSDQKHDVLPSESEEIFFNDPLLLNLAGLALNAAGATTNDQIVSLLWKNVIGTNASTSDKAPYITLLENGMTPGALAHLAADTTFNKVNINLVGLMQTGLEYIPT